MNRYHRQNVRAVKRTAKVEMACADWTELDVASEVRDLYEGLRLKIVSFSQPRATMQTPGIPDWRVYCERKRLAWWVELKREKGGKQSKAQRDFQAMAETCGESYELIDSYDAAYRHLQSIDVIPKEAA